jgi:integrase
VALKTNKARDKIDPALLDTPGKHCDGAGLYLSVARDEESRRLGLPIKESGAGGASYLFRHKNKWASIGSAHVYSIKEAREMAAKLWEAACRKQDPFALLNTLRAGPTAVGGKTFAEAMTEYLDANAPRLTASNRDRTRRDYEYQLGQVPDFVKLPIKAIDQEAKNAALATWNDRPGIREKVGYYIEAILKYAATGKLKLKAKAVNHHNPMPYAMVPAFYARLGALGTDNAKALQWVILSGARTDEVIGSKTKPPATWGEIKTDTDGKLTWIVPDTRIKTKSVFRVPLSKQMTALLGKRQADNVLLFKVSNPDALRDTLKACDGNGYHVHGFRTSFQNWILENTDYGMDIADMCIHVDKRDKNQKTYQQSNLLAKRRDISQRWSGFVAG